MFWAHWWWWLYFAAWVPITGCLVLYGLRSPWWASWTGRALLGMFAALSGVLTLVLVEQVWRLPQPLLVVLAVATLGGVCAAGCVLLALILRLQRRDREENR